MIKTEKGNYTLTFEEFAEEIVEIVPIAKLRFLKEAYDQIRRHYIIGTNCAKIAQPLWTEGVLRNIKKEYRHKYKVVRVSVDYDCDKILDFCPQDNPYELLLINEETGEGMTQFQIWQWLEEQRKQKNNGTERT